MFHESSQNVPKAIIYLTIFSPTSVTGRLQGCPTHVTVVSCVSDQYAPDIIIRHLTITNTSFSTSSPLTQSENQVIPLAPIPRVLDRIDRENWLGPLVGPIDCGTRQKLLLHSRPAAQARLTPVVCSTFYMNSLVFYMEVSVQNRKETQNEGDIS